LSQKTTLNGLAELVAFQNMMEPLGHLMEHHQVLQMRTLIQLPMMREPDIYGVQQMQDFHGLTGIFGQIIQKKMYTKARIMKWFLLS
jgi:hypothetical protein